MQGAFAQRTHHPRNPQEGTRARPDFNTEPEY